MRGFRPYRARGRCQRSTPWKASGLQEIVGVRRLRAGERWLLPLLWSRDYAGLLVERLRGILDRIRTSAGKDQGRGEGRVKFEQVSLICAVASPRPVGVRLCFNRTPQHTGLTPLAPSPFAKDHLARFQIDPAFAAPGQDEHACGERDRRRQKDEGEKCDIGSLQSFEDANPKPQVTCGREKKHQADSKPQRSVQGTRHRDHDRRWLRIDAAVRI